MSIIQTNTDRVNNLLDTELRHLERSKLLKLSTIIDKGDVWRRLLEELSSNESKISQSNGLTSKLNLTAENVNLIEKQIYCDKSPAMALLNYWSITGRRRPTVRTLINYLSACNLKWAEEYVYESILGLKKVPNLTEPKVEMIKDKPIRKIDDQYKFQDLDEFLQSIEYDYRYYDFKQIFESTNGFCDKPFDPKLMTGTKVGEGRFSTVYRCQIELSDESSHQDEQVVAAKLLKSECNMMYLSNEIDLMTRINHPNILSFLGLSVGDQQMENDADNGRYICLIYPFIENGSLLDCLNHGLCSRNSAYIRAKDRIRIAQQVADGINYLHTLSSCPLIHRDIKTANIFIDSKIEPKIGDFTLLSEVRKAHQSEADIMHSSIIGTSVYMAPETFQGDVSTKSDAFSFGIVLFELLTGLRPCDEDLDEDLFSYISERLSDIEDELFAAGLSKNDEEYNNSKQDKVNDFLNEILDKKAGEWNFNDAMIIFQTSLKLTEARKENRPEIADIIDELRKSLHEN